jgi:tRNA pseudouridine65 synthase
MEPAAILYQDDDLIFANKPSGLLVHRDQGHAQDRITLMSLVRDMVGQHVHAVNRIDRPVSGIVLFTTKRELISIIKNDWGSEETCKEYIVLSKGYKLEKGVFDFALKSDDGSFKEAWTAYIPLYEFPTTTLYKVKIKTGRKHQIRRHFSRRCMNVIGDTCYGKGAINREFRSSYDLHRIFLHSYRLKIAHPLKKTQLDITCKMPPELVNVLEKMGLYKDHLEELIENNRF